MARGPIRSFWKTAVGSVKPSAACKKYTKRKSRRAVDPLFPIFLSAEIGALDSWRSGILLCFLCILLCSRLEYSRRVQMWSCTMGRKHISRVGGLESISEYDVHYLQRETTLDGSWLSPKKTLYTSLVALCLPQQNLYPRDCKRQTVMTTSTAIYTYCFSICIIIIGSSILRQGVAAAALITRSIPPTRAVRTCVVQNVCCRALFF